MKKISLDLRVLLISTVLIFLTYSTLIFGGKVVDPDSLQIMQTLTDVNNLTGYLDRLIHFKTLDFQPLRDLTLFIDLFLFRSFKIYTFVFQNALWWVFSCFIFYKILKQVNANLSPIESACFTFAFSIFPLFSYVIPWGMARKHIMSLFFICLATLQALQLEEKNLKRDSIKITSFYFLALLSQPIGILWPAWLFIFLKTKKPYLLKSSKILFSTLAFVLITFAIINKLYYSTSSVFLSVYPAKTSDVFNFQGQILAFGHYIWTTVLPYWPSMFYTLGNWTTLAGMILSILLFAICFKFKNRDVLVWVSFSLFPLAPILLSPEMIQNTYCILPAVGMFLVISLAYVLVPKKLSYSFITVIPIWMIITHLQAKAWESSSTLLEASFENTPNCLVTNNYLRTELGAGRVPSQKILDYFKSHDCFAQTIRNKSNLLKAQLLQSRVLFYDESEPVENRISALKVGVQSQNYYALIYLTALLIKSDDPQKDLHLDELILWTKKYTPFYEVIITNVIYPYCLKSNRKDCETLQKYTIVPLDKFGLTL